MKLTKYSPANVPTVRNGKPTIRFAKQGQITFSGTAVTELGMKDWKGVIIAQDSENPEDFYVMRDDEEGFELRSMGSDSKGVGFNNASLSKKVIESFDFEVEGEKVDLETIKSVGFPIAKEAVKSGKDQMWPLITMKPIFS